MRILYIMLQSNIEIMEVVLLSFQTVNTYSNKYLSSLDFLMKNLLYCQYFNRVLHIS